MIFFLNDIIDIRDVGLALFIHYHIFWIITFAMNAFGEHFEPMWLQHIPTPYSMENGLCL